MGGSSHFRSAIRTTSFEQRAEGGAVANQWRKVAYGYGGNRPTGKIYISVTRLRAAEQPLAFARGVGR